MNVAPFQSQKKRANKQEKKIVILSKMKQKSVKSKKFKEIRKIGITISNKDETDRKGNLKPNNDSVKSESDENDDFVKTLIKSQVKSNFSKKEKAKRSTDCNDVPHTSNLRTSSSSSKSKVEGESDMDYNEQKSQLRKSSFIEKRKAKRTKDDTISEPRVRMSDTSSESEDQSESDMEYCSDSDASDKLSKLVDPTDTGDGDEKLYFDDDDDDDDDVVEKIKSTSTGYVHKQRITEESDEQDSDENVEDDREEDCEEDSDFESEDDGNPREDIHTQMGSDKDNEKDEFTAIRKELADIPFEDLLKIKEKVGVKAFNKILHGKMEDKPVQTSFKRTNKNRPKEMSSKKPVSRFRGSKGKQSWVARDPRFDDLSGQFKEYHFNKNYSFIEGIKEKERQTVKKEMKKSRSDKKKKELKDLLSRMEQEQKVQAMRKQKQDLEKTYREKERELVKEGKTPYFLKNSDKKTLELAMKFKELKQSGKLDRYMSKKRKKVAQKQRKKMPSKPS